MKLLVSLLFTLTTVLLNCMTKDGPCTEEFRMVTVSAYNSAGPVILDSAHTIRNSTSQKLTINNQSLQPGVYVVLDDTYQHLIKDSREMFTFRGFKGGQQVVNEQYDISADNCHIRKETGKDVVLVP